MSEALISQYRSSQFSCPVRQDRPLYLVYFPTLHSATAARLQRLELTAGILPRCARISRPRARPFSEGSRVTRFVRARGFRYCAGASQLGTVPLRGRADGSAHHPPHQRHARAPPAVQLPGRRVRTAVSCRGCGPTRTSAAIARRATLVKRIRQEQQARKTAPSGSWTSATTRTARRSPSSTTARPTWPR